MYNNLMDTSNLFGLIAGIAILIGYVLYFKQVIQNKSTPNPSSWAIWLLTGIIKSITYFSITNHNIWQSLPGILDTFFVLCIFIYSLFKGRFSRISKTEVLTFSLAVIIGIFWQITSDDRISNLLIQSIFIIAFVPTINGILKGYAKENINAWITVFASCLFLLISVGIGPNIDWVAFVSPIIGLLGNGLIMGSIIYKKSKK